MMHEDFLSQHPNQQLSYDLYRKHLKSMNISFARLGNEECEICEAHDIHCKSESHDKENLPSDCQVCNDYSDHKKRAEKARSLYSKHRDTKDDAHVYFSTDLEKIIMLPRLDTFKEVIFCPRLTSYNQTFAPLGKSNNEKPLAVLWHNAIAGRKQQDIISAFRVFFMKYRDLKHETAIIVQKKMANEIMSTGEPEPSHLPTVGCLRQIKYEHNSSERYDSNPVLSL